MSKSLGHQNGMLTSQNICCNVYLAMEKVGDTCCTHGAVVGKICNCGVWDRLELIRPIVSKVLCSWNQVNEFSASLHIQDIPGDGAMCSSWIYNRFKQLVKL